MAGRTINGQRIKRASPQLFWTSQCRSVQHRNTRMSRVTTALVKKLLTSNTSSPLKRVDPPRVRQSPQALVRQ